VVNNKIVELYEFSSDKSLMKRQKDISQEWEFYSHWLERDGEKGNHYSVIFLLGHPSKW